MKQIPILYGLMLILSVVSCTGEFDYSREKVNLLDVSARVITFDPAASSQKISVSSDVEWTVSEEVEIDWLSVEQLSDGISVSVFANATILERECVLSIKAGDRSAQVKVRQDGLIPSFSASRDKISVAYGGGNEIIEIQANVDWEVKTYCDWMALTKTESGLSVIMPENKTDKRRTANVDFYNAGCRLARILISQASSVPQPPDYYSLDVSSLDWSVSYVYYLNDEKGNLLSVVTMESLAGEEASVHMYPAPSGVVDYGAGISVDASVMYINNDGSRLYAENPRVGFEEIAEASQEPLVLVSDVKTHGAVKIGDQIWLSEDYKTTTFVDGTSIKKYSNGAAFWGSTEKALTVYEGHYMYTAYAAGWNGSKFDDSNFAPEGWAVPTKNEYLELIGATGKNLDNMLDGGPYNFGATLNYKAVASNSKVKVSSLGYTNTWSCTPSSSKILMMGLKYDEKSLATVSVNSGQDPKSGFSIRLIKKLEL